MIPEISNESQAILELAKNFAHTTAAFLAILHENGICTPEHFAAKMLSMTSEIDQAWTAHVDEVQQQAIDDLSPAQKEFMRLMGGPFAEMLKPKDHPSQPQGE